MRISDWSSDVCSSDLRAPGNPRFAPSGLAGRRRRGYDVSAGQRGSMPRVTFKYPDGQTREVTPPSGLTILEIARKFDIDIEGACEGSLACSTCHVIVDPDWSERLDEASEDEEDMLDLAFGLTLTSRLGCQITVTDELDGLVVTLPPETRSAMG